MRTEIGRKEEYLRSDAPGQKVELKVGAKIG